MRILFLLFSPPTGTWGSLTRVLAIAEQARKDGDRVAFCASGYLADRLRSSGYELYPVPRSTMFGLPLPISRVMEKRSQRASLPIKEGRSFGNVWFVLKLSGMAGRRYLSKLVKAELDAIEVFKPEALFTEMDPGAFLASRISGIRLFATYASVMERGRDTRTYARLMRAVRKVLEEHGIDETLEDGPFHLRNVQKLIPSIPELEEGIPSSPEYVFCGSLLGSFASASDDEFELDRTRSYVFVYVGTGSVPLGKLIEVLPEVFPAGSGWSCLVGAQTIEEELRVGNVLFRRYFDAEKIIPACDWVICHGGHNTIMQSLLSGVPLMIFPGPIFERRFNATMVQKSGAGSLLELSDFRKEKILEIMGKREAYRERAEELGARIRSYDGPGTVLSEMRKTVGGA